MKKAFILICLSMMVSFTSGIQSAQAFNLGDLIDIIGAASGSHNTTTVARGRGEVSCTASDTGWEEHWGGHSNCEDCLRVHGSCVERCSERFFECSVQGEDRFGNRSTVTSRGSERWRVEERAMDQCYNERLNDCRLISCQERTENVSTRDCARREDRHGRGRR